MKYFLLFLLISFSSYPQTSVNCLGEGNLCHTNTSCAPKIKAVELNFIKGKSEIQLGSTANFLVEIRALHHVEEVVVLFKFSYTYKKDDKIKEYRIDKIDSGKVYAIPISTILSVRSFQILRIEVKGMFRNSLTQTDIEFNTCENIGMIYNEATNSFNIETSVEAMTKAYRIWNLIPEDTLLAWGYDLSVTKPVPDTNFRQAEPLKPKIKRRKSLNHNTLFTELDLQEDTLKEALSNELDNIESEVCVTVQGTIYYEDSEGQILPLPNLTVEIWEDDFFSNDFLTLTTTDQNGHFSIYLCDNDGLFDSHLELYAVFATINNRVGVLNYTQPGGPNGFNPFSWSTWIVETGGGTVNYGNLYIMGNSLNRAGAKIFDNMQKAWSASVARGFNPSYTPIVYPAPYDICSDDGSSCYSHQNWPWDALGVIYLQPEEWINGNEDVSYHEYGHALMHRAYSDAWWPNTGGGSHTQFPQPAGFAWTEGWATFYTQVVQNDGSYNGWADLENKNYVPYGYITGEVSEWRVAQAMVDLYDTNIDGNDQGSIAYNKFISTMQSNNSNSLTQFWGQLKNILTPWEKYYGSISLIYNTIPVSQEPQPPIAPIISHFTQNPIPICKGSSGYVQVNLSQGNGNLTYNWISTNQPSYISIDPQGNRCEIIYHYSKAGEGIEAPTWNFGCTVSNGAGQSTAYYTPILNPNCGGGCPTLSFEENGELIDENPLLITSLSNPGVDVTDYYLINTPLTPVNNRINLTIHEPQTEHTWLDYAELIVTRVKKDELVAVNDDGEIINYKEATAPVTVMLNGETDITEILAAMDSIDIALTEGDVITVIRNEQSPEDNGDGEIVLGGEEPPIAKDKPSVKIKLISNKESDDPPIGELFFRPKRSVIAKSLRNVPPGNLEIEINKELVLDYLVVVSNIRTARTRTLNLLGAVHSQQGNVKNLLSSTDQNYAEILPGESIDFNFQFENIPAERIAYIVKTVGRYETDTNYIFNKTTGINEETLIPTENKLFDNYPNPFNPTTQIKYSVKENGLVTLRVYDVLGKEVAELVSEEKPSGTYTVTFDASTLSSGIYFYAITAKDFQRSKKMILIK
jgi:hypothetical protein